MLKNYRSQTTDRAPKNLITVFLIMAFFSCKEKPQKPDNNQTEPQTSEVSVVSTVAGKFILQQDKLVSPAGIVVDGQGNVYIADYSQYHIRKITPNGKSSIFAGSATGIIGFKDGKGEQALFSSLDDMVMDKLGNLIVVDMGNSMIRKIASDGTVTTLAGNGKQDLVNGPSLSASFHYPRGIAINSRGDIFVGDQQTLIRKISTDGTVSTFAGGIRTGYQDGAGSSALFNAPSGFTFDKLDNLYVADSGNNRIRVIDVNNIVTTFAGSGTRGSTDGQKLTATFSFPKDLIFDDSGNLLVSEVGTDIVRKISSTGQVSLFAGSRQGGRTNGLPGVGAFDFPQGIAFDNNGTLYVSDQAQIRKVLPTGEIKPFYGDRTTFTGTASSVYFNNPTGIVTDKQGNIYVSDTDNNMIRKITPRGDVSVLAGDLGPGMADGQGNVARFNSPMGLFVSDKNEIYVADKINGRIRKIDATGSVSTLPDYIVYAHSWPTAFYIDQTERLYLTDHYYQRLYRVNKAGAVEELSNNWGSQTNGAFMNKPNGFYVNPEGIIYILDTGNHVICRSTDEGRNFWAYAGRRGYGNFPLAGNTNGPVEKATFNQPAGMVADGKGNIYIADTGNNLIRKISNLGIVTTIAGSGIAGYADGVALSAQFNQPTGVALNASGTELYVTDRSNHLIRKIVLSK